MSDSTNVKLATPIEKDSKTLTHIELRKPNAGNLRGLSLIDVVGMKFDAAMVLIPRISTLNERDMLNMPVENMAPMMTEVACFFVNVEQ